MFFKKILSPWTATGRFIFRILIFYVIWPGPGWGPYGPMWALMGPYGPIWGPYGSSWTGPDMTKSGLLVEFGMFRVQKWYFDEMT